MENICRKGWLREPECEEVKEILDRCFAGDSDKNTELFCKKIWT